MQPLRLTLLQTDLVWQDTDQNLKNIEAKIEKLHGKTDLIVLPEMFNTGFTMNTGHAKEADRVIFWLKEQAAKLETAIIGSIIVNEEEKYYNRLLLVTNEGVIHHYDKRHLFTFSHEDKYYKPGQKRLEYELKGWRICPLICYDLRFPVWSRNTNNYDLLIYVANWPSVRSFAWKTLLAARAIENQSFVAGVNRIGTDGKGHEYSGDSVCLDFLGNTMVSCEDREEVLTIELGKSTLTKFRHAFPALADKDNFNLIL